MYYCIIKFPFSSVNDNNYTLALCLNDSNGFNEVNSFLANETELFVSKPTQIVTGDTVYNWEGTLSGTVKATDDERPDMWEPLVCSKLSFNMACENFPEWLMAYCNNNRARVIVYKNNAKPNELWRGYLIAQTLNMTVVRNLLSCPLVAVDEVAMAKYMNFKATTEYVTNDHWCSLFGLMEHYHTLHHTRGLSSATPGFEKLYYILNLSHTDRMLWHRNMCLNNDGTYVNDLPSNLVVNLDRWLPDKEKTWADVLKEVLEYLGVTFAIGSYGMMTVNDAYLLTCPTDAPTVQQFVYTFDQHTIVSHSTSQYATLSNPTKLGGNLQISAEPDKYKEVVVTSSPERWEGHDYLTDEHYKEIAPGSHVRFEWGMKENDAAHFSDYKFHKLIYIEPDDEEDDYLDIPPCENGEGYLMARNGVLPCDNISSCDNKDKPDAGCASSLDFITFKEGCCCVKIGEGEIGGVDENALLHPYFLIMNHMWGNMYGNPLYSMQTTHLADTPWIKLKPLGGEGPIHPVESHYLKINFDFMFIRENMPKLTSGRYYLYLKAPNAQTPNQLIDWTTPSILMPSMSSLADFSDNNEFNASLDLWYNLVFQAYIRIGSFYYNGTTWVNVGPNDIPPKCPVTLWSDTNEIKWVTNIGQYVIGTKNYYFTVSSPYRGTNTVDRYTNKTKLLSEIGGLSAHNQPLHGQLEIQILGQINFVSSPAGHNSLPFALLSDIDITYTDMAEILEDDIENEVKMTIDQDAHTKTTLEKKLSMATPSVSGFFNNAMIYDDGKAWHNFMASYYQNYPSPTTPERMIARRMYDQYGSGQLYVELETPVHWDDNLHNVCFVVQNLTEAHGQFLPVQRIFDYTLERMHVKLMRINSAIQE